MNRSSALAAALLALAACAEAPTDDDPPPPPPPTGVVVETFQAAGTLLGQPAWSSVPPATDPCTSSSLDVPYGAVAWDGTELLVPDSFSGRLLAFSPIPGPEADDLTAPAASWAIGKSASDVCNVTEDGTLWIPQAPVVAAGGELVVADSGLAQVFVYDAVPVDSGASASPLTVGQALVTGCSSGLLNDPWGATLVDGKLLVADSGNHRVLVFDVADTTAPLLVLGQALATPSVEPAPPDFDPFTQCAANDTDGDGVEGRTGGGAGALLPDASTMRYPTAVWSDGTRVIVADTDNNRVLVWSTFPTVSGQPADVVVGQASFLADITGTSATGLAGPQSVTSDGEQLFVADTDNNRVLVYPSIPALNGAAATIVLGQGGFGPLHVAPNDDDQDGAPDGVTAEAPDGVPSARTLFAPTGVAVVDDLLAITDTGNGRVVLHLPPAAP